MRYIALLHKDAHSSYGVSFPDLPGCFSGGETEEEAMWNAPEALALHIQCLREIGQEIPAPSTAPQIRRPFKEMATKAFQVVLSSA